MYFNLSTRENKFKSMFADFSYFLFPSIKFIPGESFLFMKLYFRLSFADSERHFSAFLRLFSLFMTPMGIYRMTLDEENEKFYSYLHTSLQE